LALALDLLGEPPPALHPVRWMGRYLGFCRKRWTARQPSWQLLEGGLGWLLGTLLSAAAAQAFSWALPGWAGALGQAALLRTLLARRALFQAVAEVGVALEAGRLDRARELLGWHLVSRPVDQLAADQVAGAAIESLAENLCDSVVAPLLAQALGGLPLAAAYRFWNTADAVWGYRGALEYSGKVAATADDLANFAPARMVALGVILAAWLSGEDALGAWRCWSRDAGLTESPNAGQSMGAFAGALGLCLEKVGHYCLNAPGRAPAPSDLPRALRLARRTLWLLLPLLSWRRAVRGA
jgi:adenosylcobinamide-phosphate synthase